MKKKYMYIIMVILLILVITFGTIIINLTTRVGNIEKKEINGLQLSTTDGSNAYITTSEHLAELNSISSSTEWKLAGSADGNTRITLPNNFNEIAVFFCKNNINYGVNIPRAFLTTDQKQFYFGHYYSTSSCIEASFMATLTYVNAQGWWQNAGSNNVTGLTTTVYYR